LRKLEIVSGIAVFIATLGYVHIAHHFVLHDLHAGGVTLLAAACFVVGLAVGILSFCGAFFLLRGRRLPAGVQRPDSAA
jgi:hypothetical protein